MLWYACMCTTVLSWFYFFKLSIFNTTVKVNLNKDSCCWWWFILWGHLAFNSILHGYFMLSKSCEYMLMISVYFSVDRIPTVQITVEILPQHGCAKTQDIYFHSSVLGGVCKIMHLTIPPCWTWIFYSALTFAQCGWYLSEDFLSLK